METYIILINGSLIAKIYIWVILLFCELGLSMSSGIFLGNGLPSCMFYNTSILIVSISYIYNNVV